MASIIQGFNYDIFISYRQKDNKGDRWVSEFVNALKTELEATFKEDISIYFDENPHDGLLETHDVDASLKEKLNCLIFIPIISRTYCDPKSFAWEHEFKVFVDQTSKDQFGLKVTLPHGNVTNRVLPVRIHDLDIADIKLCESLIGGVLRGVDFIYRSAGVNRPLRAGEDHPHDNTNKTYYRDQINKVANAVDDLLKSLKYGNSDKQEKFHKERTNEVRRGKRLTEKIKTSVYGRNPKRRFAVLIPVIICLLGSYFFYRTLYLNNTEKTLAFIPLRISNNDTVLKSDADYFVEAVNDKLNIIKQISLIPTISTLQFRNTEIPLSKIRKELKTNYLLDGNIRKDDKGIKIWIELSGAKENKTLWSKTFDWEKDQVAQLTREIVQEIASYLEIKLSPDEEKKIVTEPSKFHDANLNYISANVMLKDAWSFYNYGNRLLDSTSFSSAIEKYDKVIKEDSLFALAYAKRAIAISWGYYVRQLDSSYIEKCKYDIDKALSIDADLTETQTALGFYYYYCEIDFDKALFYFKNAAQKDPGNYQPLYYQALVYRKMGKWKESMDLMHKVIRFNPQEALFCTNIGMSYGYMHNYDSALIYHQKAIDLVPGWSASYQNKMQALIIKNGKTSEARLLLEAAIKNTGEKMIEDRIMLDIYEKKYADAFEESQKSSPSDFKEKGSKYLFLAMLSRILNNPENGKAYYDSARVILAQDLSEDPRRYDIHGLLGIAYAGLGNKAKAIAEGEKAITLSDNNKMDESDMKIIFAQILTMVGDYDDAIINLAYLLNNPSNLSERLLQLDPVWKPLMDQPEFKSKIKKYSKI